MTMVPVVAVDVDGVLALDPALVGCEQAVRDLGYRPHVFDGPGPDGEPARHGVGSTARMVRGWPSSLMRARSWCGPPAGATALPTGSPRASDSAADWPVLPVPAHGIRFGRSPKHGAVASWAQGRPQAWLDDVYGGKDVNWAEDRRDDNELPTLLRMIDPSRGLQRADIDEVLTWMRSIVGV